MILLNVRWWTRAMFRPPECAVMPLPLLFVYRISAPYRRLCFTGKLLPWRWCFYINMDHSRTSACHSAAFGLPAGFFLLHGFLERGRDSAQRGDIPPHDARDAALSSHTDLYSNINIYLQDTTIVKFNLERVWTVNKWRVTQACHKILTKVRNKRDAVSHYQFLLYLSSVRQKK